MIPKFPMQKTKRKLMSDGVGDTVLTALELVVRKKIGDNVFEYLTERDMVQTVSRSGLQKRATLYTNLDEGASKADSPFVAQIDAGRIYTETGLITTEESEIIEESAATPKRSRHAMMEMLSRELFFGPPIRQIIWPKSGVSHGATLDTVAPLIPRYPTNYYHWMIETVPKIRYLKRFEEETSREITLLVPSSQPPFVQETLELLSWPESRILRSCQSTYWIQNLIIPSFPERTLMDFEWLCGEILDAVSPEKKMIRSNYDQNNKNVYVSRANAISRRVRNEDAVMDVLSKYGFERYLLENRSLAENARLFNQADVVVGPHGAGLTDIVFAEDCTLVEFFGARLNRAYEKLSKTLGIEYEPMYCEDYSSDIVVDTDELEAKIAAIVD